MPSLHWTGRYVARIDLRGQVAGVKGVAPLAEFPGAAPPEENFLKDTKRAASPNANGQQYCVDAHSPTLSQRSTRLLPTSTHTAHFIKQIDALPSHVDAHSTDKSTHLLPTSTHLLPTSTHLLPTSTHLLPTSTHTARQVDAPSSSLLDLRSKNPNIT